MNKDKIKNALDKYDYNYIEQGDQIKVKLDFSHQIIIDLTNPNKVIIKDKLTGWNFLTGMIEMSLKNAMIYNFVGTIVFGFICLYGNLQSTKINLVSLFMIFITWVIMFTLFYLVKSENFKRQIINWTKE